MHNFLRRIYPINNNKSLFLKGRAMSSNPYKLIEDYKQHYFKYNPNIEPLLKSLLGSRHHNFDHLAIRTIDFPEVDLKKVEKLLSEYGYRCSRKYYPFRKLGVEGTHFEPHDSSLPKIFASQLLSKTLPSDLRKALHDLVSNIPSEVLTSAELFCFGRPKGWLPDYDQYIKLKQFSDYGAWLYANGYVINHFALSVELMGYHNVAEANAYLKALGHELNLSEGKEIQGSPEVYLEQSSTKANKLNITFKKNTQEEIDAPVPATFLEIVQRFQMKNGQLFGDFIAESAEKIFHSTADEVNEEINEEINTAPTPYSCAR